MAVNLEKMSLEELKKHQKDVEKAIKSHTARQKKEAMKALQKTANQFGMTVEEIVGGTQKKAAPKASGKAKYKNPDNPAQTWTGRGRQPAWFKEAIAKGKTPDQMAV